MSSLQCRPSWCWGSRRSPGAWRRASAAPCPGTSPRPPASPLLHLQGATTSWPWRRIDQAEEPNGTGRTMMEWEYEWQIWPSLGVSWAFEGKDLTERTTNYAAVACWGRRSQTTPLPPPYHGKVALPGKNNQRCRYWTQEKPYFFSHVADLLITQCTVLQGQSISK